MTSIELNRGFPHLNGKEAVDTKNRGIQQNQQIGKEIHYLRFKRYSNSDFFLVTLEPSVEKYMRENLFLASYEQKNPVNDRAEEYYQTRTDLRVNALIKKITDAQKEFVQRGKNLIQFFKWILEADRGRTASILFNYMYSSTKNLDEAERKKFMESYKPFKEYAENFLLFHSSRFFNDFEDHTSFGNYYINYSYKTYLELEKFIKQFELVLTDELLANKDAIEKRDLIVKNFERAMKDLRFVGGMLLERENANHRFDGEVPEIEDKCKSLDSFFNSAELKAFLVNENETSKKKVRALREFNELKNHFASVNSEFIEKSSIEKEEKILKIIAEHRLGAIPELFFEDRSVIPKAELYDIVSSIDGNPNEWMDPFCEPKISAPKKKKTIPDYPKSESFQKLNNLHEIIVSTETKSIPFVVKKNIERNYEIVLNSPEDFAMKGLFVERNNYYTFVDTFGGLHERIDIRQSKAIKEPQFFKKDESLPDLVIFNKFNFVSLLRDEKYYFETFLRKNGPKIDTINFSMYNNNPNSVIPRGSSPRETMEEILFHSYDYRERRRGKMYAVVYESKSGENLIAFDKEKKYNLTKKGEYIDEYTREALLYAANITKINTNLEVKGKGGDRRRSIHSTNFFITVSVVRPIDYFYQVQVDIPYDIKICSTNIYPYLPIINLHHKQITHSKEAPGGRVNYRDPVWMQKFSTSGEYDGIHSSVEVQDISDGLKNTGATLVYSTPKQFALDILAADGRFSIMDFAEKLRREKYTWNGYSVNLKNFSQSIINEYDSKYLWALVNGATPKSVDVASLNKILRAVSTTIFNKLMHYYFNGEKFTDFTLIMNQAKHEKYDFTRETIEVSKNYNDNNDLKGMILLGGEKKNYFFSNVKKDSGLSEIYIGTINDKEEVNIEQYFIDIYKDIVNLSGARKIQDLWKANPEIQFISRKGNVYFKVNLETHRKKFEINLASKISDKWKIDVGMINRSEFRESLDPFDISTGGRKKVGKQHGNQISNVNESYDIETLNRLFNMEGRKVIVRDNSVFLDIDHSFWTCTLNKDTKISRVITIQDQDDFDRMLLYITKEGIPPKSMADFANIPLTGNKIGIADLALKEFLFEWFIKLSNGDISKMKVTSDLYMKIRNFSGDRNVHKIYELETSAGLTFEHETDEFLYYFDDFYMKEVKISKVFIEKRPLKFTLVSSSDSNFNGDVRILNLKILSFIDSILEKNIVSKLIAMTKKSDITPSEIGSFLYEKLNLDSTKKDVPEKLSVLFESIGLSVSNTSARIIEQGKIGHTSIVIFKEGPIKWK